MSIILGEKQGKRNDYQISREISGWQNNYERGKSESPNHAINRERNQRMH
jgi:hypothetical protein